MVLAVPACGSGSSDRSASAEAGSEDAQALLSRAIETTGAVESGRVRLSVEASGTVDDRAVDLDLVAEGSFTDQGRSSEMSADLAPLIQEFAEDGDEVPSSFQVQVVSVGPDTWMKLAIAPAVPAWPSGWIHMDPRQDLDSSFGAGALGGLGDEALSGDPEVFLDALRTEGVAVRDDGRDEVDGVEVTVLTGEIDPKAAIAVAPPEEAAEAQRSLDESGVGPIPFKVYVDDDGLIRRVELDVAGSTEDGSVDVTIVVELFDAGDPVDIAPPPADEVVELPQLDMTPFASGALEPA
jgi:hypothetical protein